MRVSILIPTRNEEAYIAAVLENILAQEFPADAMEVFVIDGDSTDNTRRIVEEYAEIHASIHLLDNPNRIVPHALNKGLKEASGGVIIRMDAHCEYPNNYVSRLVDCLENLSADNVGAVWATVPSNDSYIARAIAASMTSLFGVGNSAYRLGATEIKQVDTVPFGCYRKEVFEKIGGFDEDLIRNQDDEFNARLIKNGGTIYLIPDVVIKYFARDTVRKMCRMFFQYGLFKPLVLKKTGAPATVRQLIPLFFVLANVGLVMASLFASTARWGVLGMYVVYLLVALGFAFRKAAELRDYSLAPILPGMFLLMHLSYGTGYLVGIFRFLVLGQSSKTSKLEINR